MSRDYRRAHGYKPRAQLPGWLWFITGIGMGLLIALMIYLKRAEIFGNETVARNDAPVTIDIPPAQPGVTTPRFDFYTILPDQEIVVPDADNKEKVTIKEAKEVREPKETKLEKPAKPAVTPAKTPSAKTTPVQPPAAAARKGAFVLQVGSFKRLEEADRLKAALALIGIESSIQVVQLSEGDNWHRVRVGPFDDMARVTEARTKLKQNKFSSIILQVKS